MSYQQQSLCHEIEFKRVWISTLLCPAPRVGH